MFSQKRCLKMKNNDILYSLLKLGGYEHKDFSEIEVSSALHTDITTAKKIIEQNKQYLIITKKSKTKCICGADIKIANNLDFAMCSVCKKKIDINSISSLNIGLDYSALSNYFRGGIIEFLESKNWIMIEHNDDKFEMKKKNAEVCFSFGLTAANLDDYFLQRGWLNKPDIDAYIIIRPIFEADLIAYTQKDLKCVCINLIQVLKEDIYEQFEKFLLSRIRLFKENQDVEDNSGLSYDIL